MLRATPLMLCLLASCLPAMAAPKFAVVKVTDIYRNLTSTQTMLADIQKDREEILKDERAIQLRNILEEMKELQKQLQAKHDAPVDDATRKLAQQFELKRQEAQTLQEEFQLFDTEKKKEINRKMVTSMRASLEKINATTHKVAEEQGFEATFDSSGNSNTGVPILLYAKNAKDITNDVVARLKDSGEPSGPPAPQAPAPDAAAPTTAPAPAAPSAPASGGTAPAKP